MTEADMQRVVAETVEQTLARLGIDVDQPFEFQKDMAYIRTWRTSSESFKRQGFLTAAAVLTTGFLGLIWMAFKGQGN